MRQNIKTFDDVAADVPNFIDNVYNATGLHSALGYPTPTCSKRRTPSPGQKEPAARSSTTGALHMYQYSFAFLFAMISSMPA
jgi:hypothetical protein